MRILTIIALIAQFTFVIGQQSTVLIGGSQSDLGKSIIECSNGEMLLAGHTESYGAGQSDIFISRLNQNGQIIWSKTFGFSAEEDSQNFGLFEAANGDILCSFFTNGLNQFRIGVILRLDANGIIIWQKKIGSVGGDSEWTRGIIEHDDGSIYVGNTVNNQLFGSSDGMITKLDPNGDIIWSKSLGETANDHIWSLIPLPNNEILLNMNSQALGPGSRSAILVKMDSDGNVLNEISFGGNSLELMSDVKYDGTFGFLVTGGTTSYGQGDRDAFVAKFDLNFNLEWFKTYGGSLFDHGVCVEVVDSDSYLLYMNSTNPLTSDKQLCLINLDGNGNTIFSKAIGDNNIQEVDNSGGQSIFYSDQQDVLYLTGLYGDALNSSNALFISTNGKGDELCEDTLMSESFHNPTVEPVNFSIGDHGYVSNINIITNDILNINQNFICSCPIDILELVDTTICEGSNLGYSLDTNLNYSWSPSNLFSCDTCPDPSFTGSSSTSVTVIYDDGVCTDSSEFLITVNPTDPLNIVAPDSVCDSEQPFIIDVNGVQGVWSGVGVNGQTGEFDPSMAQGEVQLIFSPSNQCLSEDSIIIYVEESIVANIDFTLDTVCFDMDMDTLFSLNASPNNGFWSGNAIYDSVNGYFDEPIFNGGPTWIYYTPYGNCVLSDSISINPFSVEESEIVENDTLCSLDSEFFLEETNGYSGIWSGDGIVSPNDGGFSPSDAQLGINNVIFIPENTCYERDTIELFVNQSVVAEIFLEDTSICINSPPLLLQGFPQNGEWTGFSQVTVGNEIYFSSDINGVGTYTVYLNPLNECSQSDSVVIDVNTLEVSVTDSIETCNNVNSINIEVSPVGGDWSGYESESVIQNNTVDATGLSPGVYEYIYQFNNGCVDSDTLILQVFDSPDITLSEDTTLCYGCEIELILEDINQNDSIYWSNGSNGQSITVSNGGVYSVYVINEYGCVDSSSVYISEVCNSSIYIPNSFTPNESGVNDMFKVYGENIEIHSFEVYNRWGTIIYNQKSNDFSWDGRYRNRIVQDGVYVYKIEYFECSKKELKSKVGHITVLK